MIEKIFNELFGDVDFTKAFDSFNDNDENCKDYYHIISDKYEDGKRVSHIEREIRDGKVLKNVKEDKLFKGSEEPKKLNGDNEELRRKLDEVTERYNKLKEEHEDLKSKIKTALQMK